MAVYIPERVALRAASNCTEGLGGCLLSNYSIGSHGYAQIGWHEDGKRQATTAHRAAWVAYTGEQIPDGVTVDHTCRVRRCVNPRHLRLLSNLDNARDNGQGRSRIPPVTLLGRRCHKGHQIIAWSSGQFGCRPCELERGRRKYPARRERQRAARQS